MILVALVFTVLYRQCQQTNFLAILTTLASSLIHCSKVKHVEVEIHLTSKKMAKGGLTLQFVHVFHEQLADILTKGLCYSPSFVQCQSNETKLFEKEK